ncbi:phosphoribosylglycinamide formyltransferase [Pelagibacteraceae bacterium]|nr:phosphoribosylglycinamide formyltransferase [Pelagibacteraceae bacterium]
MIKKNCAVFISGRGSNLESLIKESKNKNFPIQVELIISDNVNARGLKFSEVYNIDSYSIDYSSSENKDEFEQNLLNELKNKNIELICLAGFMRILSSKFINSFSGPILNIHPSLLPKYKGLNTHQRAIDNNEKITGCTVHFVSEELDSGEIILQKSIDIGKNDTAEKLMNKVLKLEHQAYPEAIKRIFS